MSAVSVANKQKTSKAASQAAHEEKQKHRRMRQTRRTRPEPAEQKEKFSWKNLFTLAKGSDPWITAVTVILIVFGMIMVISTKQGTTIGDTGGFLIEVIKQLMFLIVAWEFGVVYLSRHYPYGLFNYKSMQNILIAIYTIVLVLVALVGTEAGGSKAWLRLFGGLTIQPSEFGKPLLIILLASAARFAGMKKKAKSGEPVSFFRMFSRPLILMGISIIFIGGLQKDFGSLIITLGIGLVGLLVTSDENIEKWQRIILISFLVILIILIIGIYFSDIFVRLFSDTPLLRHIAIRIENMQDPYANIHSQGYQPANALYSLADSGIFGKGLGNSVRKYGFLTQAESDYILAIVVEETGIIGLGLISICYAILLWRLAHWALAARKPYDKVLFSCSAAYFMLHFFINVGGVSTLIPMTGVPLLMISAGGSALISACMVIGICQNRIARLVHDEKLRLAQKETLRERIEESDEDLVYEDS